MEDDIRAKMRASMQNDSSPSNSKSEDTPGIRKNRHYNLWHELYALLRADNPMRKIEDVIDDILKLHEKTSEPPQDTSLDVEGYVRDMFLMVWRDATAGLGAEKHVVCNAATGMVMRKLTQQQAKLLQVIEDEVIGKYEITFPETLATDVKHTRNQLKAEQRQALKQIKERL